MAPMAPVNHDALEQQLKEALQSMYNIMVQTTAYDASAAAAASSSGSGATATPSSSSSSTATPPAPASLLSSSSAAAPLSSSSSSSSSRASSRDVLAAELRALQQTLQAIHRASTPANRGNALPHVPPELIQYVENGRNPDIYTREFVELVRRGNQLMRGKQDAFRAFRDVLAGEVAKAMPELRDDVRRVVAATDGAAEPPASAPPKGEPAPVM